MNNSSTILIIDDDEISLLILQNAFETEGYNVVTTTDSTKAEELFIQHSPHTVILDIFMPDRDGFEVIKDIKSRHENCRIIAISANERYLPAIKALGATATVHKSAMPDEIVATVRGLPDYAADSADS